MNIFSVKLTNRLGTIFYMRSDRILSMMRQKVSSFNDNLSITMPPGPAVELTYLEIEGRSRPMYCRETPEEVQALLVKGDYVVDIIDRLKRIEELLKNKNL